MAMPAHWFSRCRVIWRAWVSAIVVAVCGLCGPVSAADLGGTRHQFDIPGQPLDQALLAFSRQSGRQLVASGLTGTPPRAAPVRGWLREDTALRRLLAGTGLGYQVRADGTVVVAPRERARTPAPAKRRGDDASVPAERVHDLATVRVTARKRQEDRERVPLAVTSVTAPQIDAQRIHSAAEALRTVPGASSIDTGGGFTQVQLRGVSSSLGGNDNGYYLDESPFTGVTVPWYPDARTFDIERIEVLRGPQGTLFGEGAMGGTVRILTRKPVLDAFAATVRASLSTTHGGGGGHGLKGMFNLPLVDDRLGLRVVLTDEQLPGWVDDPATGREDLNAQRIHTARVRLRFSPDDATDIDASYWRWRSAAPGGGYSALDGMLLDVLYGRQSSWASRSLVVERRLGGATLTYVGAGTRLDNLHEGELAPGADYMTDIRIGVDTHELRLASAGEHRLEWTAGLYRRDASRHDRSRVWPEPLQEQWQDNHAWALFGELGYLLPGNRWSLTAGLRYFRDQVHGISLTEGNGVRIDADFPALSPKFMVSWMPSGETLIYGSVSSGFRSGQLQPVMSILAAEREGLELPVAIDPDRIVSYEIGGRRSWQSGRIAVEGALFVSDWKDVAVRIPLTETLNGLLNSRGVDIRGVELAVAFAPAPGNRLQLTGSIVDTAYREAIDGTPIERGDPVYNVPRTSLGAAWDRHIPLASGHALGLYARMRYDSARKVSLTRGSPGDPILSLDAGMELASRHGWSVSLYGENLLDEDGAVDARNIRGAATRLRPRTLGLEVEWSY